MLSVGLACFWVQVLTSNAAPIKQHFVDMTHPFDEFTLNYPNLIKFEMTVLANGSTGIFDWLQFEEFKSGTHTGTHMDAPSDFIKDGINLEQIPLEKLTGPAAVIDITERANQNPDAEAVIDDLLHWESLTGQTLNGTIIFIRTGWSRYWYNQTAYFGNPNNDMHDLHFPGIACNASKWLVDNRDIKGIGIDTLSPDHGPDTAFSGHLHLLSHEVVIYENVANIDKIPIYGATVRALPINLDGATGGPVRIIATYPEVLFSPPTYSNEVETDH